MTNAKHTKKKHEHPLFFSFVFSVFIVVQSFRS